MTAHLEAVEIDKGHTDVRQQAVEVLIRKRFKDDGLHLPGQLVGIFEAVGLRRLGVDEELPRIDVVEQLERDARSGINQRDDQYTNCKQHNEVAIGKRPAQPADIAWQQVAPVDAPFAGLCCVLACMQQFGGMRG